MKTRTCLPLVLISCLLVTCTVDNPGHVNHCYTAFYLGETSFTFKGKIEYTEPDQPWMPQPEPFNQVFVRLRHWDWESYPDEGWKTQNVPVNNDTFQITIGITANGVTLNEALLSGEEHEYLAPLHFPDDFPAVELSFAGPRGGEIRNLGQLLSPLGGNYARPEYDYDDCDYIYVAKPIDLSKYEQTEGDGVFGYTITTYDYDLNFSKPGWYKVVAAPRKGNSEAELSSSTNNVFRRF